MQGNICKIILPEGELFAIVEEEEPSGGGGGGGGVRPKKRARSGDGSKVFFPLSKKEREYTVKQIGDLVRTDEGKGQFTPLAGINLNSSRVSPFNMELKHNMGEIEDAVVIARGDDVGRGRGEAGGERGAGEERRERGAGGADGEDPEGVETQHLFIKKLTEYLSPFIQFNPKNGNQMRVKNLLYGLILFGRELMSLKAKVGSDKLVTEVMTIGLEASRRNNFLSGKEVILGFYQKMIDEQVSEYTYFSNLIENSFDNIIKMNNKLLEITQQYIHKFPEYVLAERVEYAPAYYAHWRIRGIYEYIFENFTEKLLAPRSGVHTFLETVNLRMKCNPFKMTNSDGTHKYEAKYFYTFLRYQNTVEDMNQYSIIIKYEKTD